MKMCNVHRVAAASLVLLVGCSKSEGGGTAAGPSASAVAVPSEAPPVIAITATPVAPSVEAPSASAAPSAAASAKPAASAVTKAGASASAKEAAPPLKPAATRVAGKNFTLDAASPGCRVETPCTMTLRLAASGEYHVNKEYPYKFVAAAAPGVQFLGNGDANTFSRAAGDFKEEGEKAATLTVRFKPAAAGEARVSGTYKMSVCSAENCQIETQSVTLAVPVM